ncbi:two component transcriptional regulator, winged helix family [Catenulispora acidiphila DSM 44928]|uniref:Two component transcriptional regulator, winged helix family n=1 Tax=Catenulispora acidiphila (strain DSM 44928 / JCM 14897 / NBRC 102108 / NRRL B-24433 / ID139908) TaxID=479433 RepID=C7QFW4_CATAD|nr:response regulator transcription factor [Catenulispora acidiphila]ACU70941.1 two component transcriptional regulator, winged helix family [Catenulispora acidiphila DSM 44928]
MKRLLVVDDEAQLLVAVRINLSARGYEVSVAPDGTTGLAVAARRPPDLVVLDLGLPDMDGVQVIDGLRGWTTVPILVLSGRTESWDKVEALDAGADDFVTKPFDMDELAARVRSLLRRAEPENATGPVIQVGHHLVDLAARTVKRAPGAPSDVPESVRLTRTEWAVLEMLLRHPDRLVSSKQLLAHVWGTEHEPEGSYLRFYLARLRQKLEPEPSTPRQLLTEPGMGYRFQPLGSP